MNKYIIAALIVCGSNLLAEESGKVTNQVWLNIPGANLTDILNDDRCYGVADLVEDRTTLSVGDNHGAGIAQRARGFIVAPITGKYRFWLTGTKAAQFSLSPTASKVDREVQMELSTWKDQYDWDNGVHSKEIDLVAGQEYFVELVQKNDGVFGHANVAWAYQDHSYENWAVDPGAVATQSTISSNGSAERANDGDTNGDFYEGSVSFTDATTEGNWWQIDLGQDRPIDHVVLWNRSDKWVNQLSNFRVSVLAADGTVVVSKDYFTESSYVRGIVLWDLDSEVTGSGIRVEMLGANRKGNYALSLAEVQVFGSTDVNAQRTAREIVGGEHLMTYTSDAEDSDLDDLPDSWELSQGFDTTTAQSGNYSLLADVDRDGLRALEESAFNTDPFTGTSLTGYLTVEKWAGISAFSVDDLVQHDRFFMEADTRALTNTNHYTDLDSYSGARLRGYITAPESGVYRFWVSGSVGAELWLSTDSSKYFKRRLAVLGGITGSGSAGVPSNSNNLWDQFATQISEDIYLVEGQKYFIEALSQQHHSQRPHISVAWSRPDQEREALPIEFVSSYEFTTSDLDDDYLPDLWESQFGLSIIDNGAVDREHEGENGDFDMDGLSNRLEYVYGSNPTNPDHDGDGILDGDEVHSYGTDPSVSDAPSETLLTSVDLSTFTNSDTQWASTSEGLVSSSFRGGVSWSFTVPSDGYFVLHLSTKLLGDLYLNETVPANLSVDGRKIWEKDIVYGQQREALVRVTTPYLIAGQHSLYFFVDNMIARRSVSIKALEVFQPNGIDSDGDGKPDWVESQLSGLNTLFPYQSSSRTSPAFLEGNARILEFTQFNGTATTPSNGNNGWFADLVLHADGSGTDFTVNFESGLVETGTIAWATTNVVDGESLIIRKGDSLKLGAWSAASNGATITAEGVSYTLADQNATAEHTFNTAGTITVTAILSDGAAVDLTVIVKHADFTGAPQDFLSNSVDSAVFLLSDVNADLFFDAGEQVEVLGITSTNTKLNIQLSLKSVGEVVLAARLFENGPILNTQSINLISISDAIQNDLTTGFLSREFDGYYILTTPLVATNLPVGGQVKVTINRAGVTFPDGTKTQWLNVEDFVNDTVYLDFLFPVGMAGGYCHYLRIYDRNGAYIGRR